jgi:reactive intermediate/imine deaminase
MTKQILPMDGPLAQSGTFAGKVAFSNGVRISGGPLLFISGQLAFDDQRNLVGKGDMKAQTRQVLHNIKKVLDWAGATPADIVKVTVFVKDISKFREIHDARLEFFPPDHLPASTMVEVSRFVHPDALIEIEAVAALPG